MPGTVPDGSGQPAVIDAMLDIDAAWPQCDARPALPDACSCPVAERFVLHEKSFEIASGFAINSPCDAQGELAGTEIAAMSCVLATDDIGQGTGLSLLGPSWSSRMTGAPGSCAWNMPDGVRRDSLATAVCLRPAESGACEPQVRVIRRRAGGRSIPAGSERELTVSCEAGEVLIAGACIPERHERDISLLRAGFRTPGISGETRAWQCSFRNRGTDNQIDAMAFCIEGQASACGCCSPLEERFVFEQRIQNLVPEGDTLLQIACPEGARLVAGSCSIDDELEAITDIILHRMGFAPHDAGVWQCAWANLGISMPQGRATAACLTTP